MKLKLINGKLKVVNIICIKPYCEELKSCLFEDAPCSSESAATHLFEDTSHPSQGASKELSRRPLTRALKSSLISKMPPEQLQEQTHPATSVNNHKLRSKKDINYIPVLNLSSNANHYKEKLKLWAQNWYQWLFRQKLKCLQLNLHHHFSQNRQLNLLRSFSLQNKLFNGGSRPAGTDRCHFLEHEKLQMLFCPLGLYAA